MVVADPSCRTANVTRNVRPYRLAIMRNEFFRAYKATEHGDWELLMFHFTTIKNEASIFEFYPPSDDEQQHLYDVQRDERKKLDHNASSSCSNGNDDEEYEEWSDSKECTDDPPMSMENGNQEINQDANDDTHSSPHEMIVEEETVDVAAGTKQTNNGLHDLNEADLELNSNPVRGTVMYDEVMVIEEEEVQMTDADELSPTHQEESTWPMIDVE